MEPEVDTKDRDSLLIITKYNTFFMYLYPMVINMSNKHRVLRNKTLEVMLDQYGHLQLAVKTKQVSKLYVADTGVSTLREHLRILSNEHIKLISRRQYGVATGHLSEVGKLIGSMINKSKKVK